MEKILIYTLNRVRNDVNTLNLVYNIPITKIITSIVRFRVLKIDCYCRDRIKSLVDSEAELKIGFPLKLNTCPSTPLFITCGT